MYIYIYTVERTLDTNEAEKSVSSFQRLKQEWYILGAEKVSPISLVSLMCMVK